MTGMMPGVSPHVDLQIDRTDEGWLSQVRRSPAGQGESRFINPFRPRDLQKVWEAIHAAQTAGRATAPQKALIQDMGRRLFEAAFVGEVLGCLRASFDEVAVTQERLRLHLDLSSRVELESLPWEFLYNPERSEFVSLSLQSPLARYIELSARVLPVKAPKPLRMLAVLAGPGSYPRVDVDHEWLDLLDTIDFLGRDGRLIVERLTKPTLLDLQRRLRQGEYHLLHFVGHAVVDKLTGEGRLILEDEMGRARPVNGQHLGALLRDHTTLRQVMLAGPTRSLVDADYRGLLDVARSLVQRGIAATVAPQTRIGHADWLAFCREVYERLAQWQPVDEAVVHGRQAMFALSEDVCWGAPVLFTRAADGRLFDDGRSVKPVAPETLEQRVLSRLNSLIIRSANPETIARWRDDLSEPPHDERG
jgi:hypothetical protein